MKLLAHITRIENMRKEQTLKEHCRKTAEYAGHAVEKTGLFHTAYLAGLLHDMGKATHLFQTYLESAFRGEEVRRGTVNHTFAGTVFCLERYHIGETNPMKKLTGELIAYAIGAHHGLFDCLNLEGRNGFEYRLQKDKKEIAYEEAKENFLTGIAPEGEIDREFAAAVQEVTGFFSEIKEDWGKRGSTVMFQLGLLARILLSAVIEGDRRDTKEFMSGKKEAEWSADREFWEKQSDFLEGRLQGFRCDTGINQVRGFISESCRRAAERKSGIYRLNVPTGSGKTLSSLRFALRHAELCGKKRIVFLIPLLSVLEQNVSVIKENVADRTAVLEHHSNLLLEEETSEHLELSELLKETWSAPVIVSTLVQFLDILFAHRTSAVRRMQALADSVIVFDEVQSVPKKLLYMFNNAVNFLNRYCNCTIVLCSATQPCLEDIRPELLLEEKPDLVLLNRTQRQFFHRAEIVDRTTPYGMTLEELAVFCSELLEKSSSLLIICNTKGEAAKLYNRLNADIGHEDVDLSHLSTSMCAGHRKNVLEKIRIGLEQLQKGSRSRKCVCVSTQLIEAGIDVSFEAVVRVSAGLDNIAQSAGRCNRSNEYGHVCRTYIVNLKNEQLRYLRDIQFAQDSAKSVLLKAKRGAYGELLSDEAIFDFYHDLFHKKEVEDIMEYPLTIEGISYTMTDLLGTNIARRKKADGQKTDRQNTYILGQAFLEAGKRFQVFDENTTDVLVPYKEGREILANLCSERALCDIAYAEEQLERAKQYSISIFEYQKKWLLENKLLHQVGKVYLLSEGAYDEQALGLIMEGGSGEALFF